MAEADSVEEGTENENVNIRQFLEQWLSVLDPRMTSKNDQNNFEGYLSEKMDITPEIFQELSSVCSVDALKCQEEPSKSSLLLQSIPEGIDLTTVQAQKKELVLRKQSNNHEKSFVRRLKYKDYLGPWVHHKLNEANPDIPPAIQDVVISVQVYKSNRSEYCRPRLTQSIDVLGSQKLTALKDAIICIADEMIVGEYSEISGDQLEVKAQDMFKSGFFFIENVFYNDLRCATCKDYSKLIIDWAKDPSRKLPSLSAKKMEETTFLDLELSVGKPFLYAHQGNCEHGLIVSDIRLHQSDDCQDLSKYPVITGTGPLRQIKCRVCRSHLACWLTYNSPVSPEDPCFFCETCFRMLHYDSSGQRTVADFRAFKYPSALRHRDPFKT